MWTSNILRFSRLIIIIIIIIIIDYLWRSISYELGAPTKT